MKTAAPGIDLIKSFEGFKANAYKDSVGVWTIGYGHTANVMPGDTITRAQGEQLLKTDLQHVEKALNDTGAPLNQNQFDALASLFFNVGTGYIPNFKPLITSDPKSPAIPEKIKLYNKAGGKVLPGLVRRREAEAALYKKKA